MLPLILAVVAYLACYSTIPVLDKLALATVQQHALTWAVLSLATLLMSTYALLFTDAPCAAAGIAVRSPYVLGSGAITTLWYLAYFHILAAKGVLFVVMLQPVLLIAQTGLAVAVLREPIDRWNVAGIGVMALGIVIYNVAYLLGVLQRKPE
jgi:uncharacterized membrane protein